MKQAPPSDLDMTSPLFPELTSKLMSKLQKLNQKKLQATLEVSPALATLNYERFQTWDQTEKRPALWMYSGDVYNGIDAFSMSKEQTAYAQGNLLIASGLYGLVRPLDGIQPYRLEMKLPFAAGKAKNLYDYWGPTIGQHLIEANEKTLLICASKEYAKAVSHSLPKDIQTLTPRFYQETSTGLKEKGLFAKYARGALARWAIDNQVTTPEGLRKYTSDGFQYSQELSTKNEIIYIVPTSFSLKGRFVKK